MPINCRSGRGKDVSENDSARSSSEINVGSTTGAGLPLPWIVTTVVFHLVVRLWVV
jgi:hypothetical protein